MAPQQPSIRATPPSSRAQRSSYAARTVSGAMAVAWQPGKKTYRQFSTPGWGLERKASPLENSMSISANSCGARGILSVDTMFRRAVAQTCAISKWLGQTTVHWPQRAQAFMGLLSWWSPMMIWVLL